MHHEYKGHIHIHTSYSDGSKLHAEIAEEAIAAGLDFIITTDHNVWVDGVEGYYGDEESGRVLLLVGEEVHDVRRWPQANHCLVFGAEKELSAHAADPQELIDAASAAGGFSYLAHPFEIASTLLKGDELSALGWEEWHVSGYAGLEIWNYMSEFKSHMTSKWAAVRAAYRPEQAITGPFGRTIAKWDELLSSGRQVACIAGGDVHGKTYSLGPLSRVLFPYRRHFQSLNNHILASQKLTGEFAHDKQLVLEALRRGNSWVAYDAAGDTAGFRFSAHALRQQAVMGDMVRLLSGGVTFQITAPAAAHIRLIRHGEVVAESLGTGHLLTQASEPGAYRAEAFTRFAGRKRAWIYSNPIYVRKPNRTERTDARFPTDL